MQAPSWLTAQFLVNAVTIVAVVHIMLISLAYCVYAERKVCSYIQDRIGPNRTGFDFGLPFLKPLRGMLGLGQSLADGLKFILKEDYTPNRVDKVLFTLAPGMVIVPALMGFIVIPWGGWWECPSFSILGMQIQGGLVHVTGANVNIGIVYLLGIASLGIYGVTLGGFASNNKFAFLGSIRATAQMISYEIPLGLMILCVLLTVGTIVPDQIVRHQYEHGWLILHQPLTALLFFITILAEANRAPFDNAEAEQELVAGYHIEYSAMRMALFLLAEYGHLLTSAAFFALLFLGGYQLLPFVHDPLTSPAAVSLGAVLIKLAVFFGKVFGLIGVAMFVRWTIPRLRFDQIMHGAWQMVIPLSLVLVVVVSVMVYFGTTGLVPMLGVNLGIALLFTMLLPFMPRREVNKRLPLSGSRYCPLPGERVATAPSHAMAIEDRPIEGSVPKMT